MNAQIDRNQVIDMAGELLNASSLLKTETGEYWASIALIASRVIDCGSNRFLAAYVRELRDEVSRLRCDFRVIESTETRTITRRELRHVSEMSEGVSE